MFAYSDRIGLNFNSSIQNYPLLDPKILKSTVEKNYEIKKKAVMNVHDITDGSDSTFVTVRYTMQAFYISK